MMVFSHQFGLVFLSVLAVTTSGMTAVAMTLRAASAMGRLRLLWAGGAALSLATGIWSMHFIGMLALQVPIGLSFDVGMTAFSFLPAMAAS
ncbi:MAG TPA: MHYT domain-containing protein, partial [Burkholderiaceae bacterium]|nr:MHYT domain-containing protein [Burkholderiaceae bacterium]